MHTITLSRLIAAIIFFVLLIPPLSPVHSTEYYAFRLTGSDCLLCHTDPKTGSLTPTGIQFQERGYRYPLTREGLLFFFLLSVPLMFILFGCYRRLRLWRLGKEEGKWEGRNERWKSVVAHVFGQRSTLRSLYPGISHGLLFGSLILLILAVTAILLQEHLFLPLWGTRWIGSGGYPYLRLALDLLGAIGWIGTMSLGFRRYVQRPKALDHQWSDGLVLGLLFSVFLTGFLATGIRNEMTQSPWSGWAPIASSVTWVLKVVLPETHRWASLFPLVWWTHLFLSLILLASIPFSRLLHLITSPLNIFFRNLESKGSLSLMDLDATEVFGVEKIEEFTWKHLLELDACTRCGRCQEACPAHLSQKPLNPKKIVQNLKRHMEEHSSREGESLRIIGSTVSEEEIWECTTCRNCLEHCPVFIEPMTKLLEFRRNLVLTYGKIPKETRFAFRNIENKGNPWGFDPGKRMWWTKEQGIKEVSPGEEVDILFWVGCYGSYDDRNIEVTSSLVQMLNRAEVNFGVLGKAEWCCGIDLRRMGSEYLFQVNVEKNLGQLRQVRFQKILTTCPHCFNTLKNEYTQFGAQWEVIHYTAFLDQWIREGKISLHPQNRGARVTFHDSCYLGRYNDGYDPPRRILGAMSDLGLSEMERSREKGFCCGGGGCHMWMEEKQGRRISQMRVEEAEKTGAEILATVCPLCLISLDSAIKVLNLDDRIRVMDLLELVKERIKP